MAQLLTEMAKDLILALIEAKLLAPEDMQQHLQQIHASLCELKAREDRNLDSGVGRGETISRTPTSKNWKKSIKKNTVDCLICGQTFKQLSKRHLSQYDLDPRTYRQQFGIPGNQPLSSKETTALRRRVVQENRPWEKAPTYKKAQEEPAPPSPARPKRTRKKAPTTVK